MRSTSNLRSEARADESSLPGSLATGPGLSVKGVAPERRRRAAVGLLEGGREMTVTGEAEIEAQRGEVVILRQQIERSCESELHLTAIQRHAFHLLKDLREVDRGMANFGADLGQCPAPGRSARQHHFGS